MIDWNLYPSRGRTQWFAAVHANRPSGVGFGYHIVTTEATGIYAIFNTPIRLITTEGTTEEDLVWVAEAIPPGFTAAPLLSRKINPMTQENEWNLFVPRDLPGTNIIVKANQSFPNLRLAFTLPQAQDQFGDPIPELPSQWTFTPLTRQQVEAE